MTTIPIVHLFYIYLPQFIVVSISLILFFFLWKRKNIFPYANISPIWTMAFLFCNYSYDFRHMRQRINTNDCWFITRT